MRKIAVRRLKLLTDVGASRWLYGLNVDAGLPTDSEDWVSGQECPVGGCISIWLVFTFFTYPSIRLQINKPPSHFGRGFYRFDR
jgi:hypothetical protein